MQINPYKSQIALHPKHLLPYPNARLLTQCMAQSKPYDQLWVDLGCGAGGFLLQHAEAFVEHRFVGFELRYKRLVRSAQKAERLRLHNVWFLHERAESFDTYFPPQTVDRLYILFPEPWPKWRDWDKRLLNGALLKKAGRVLKSGGLLCVKTDYSGQFLHFLSAVHRQNTFETVFFSNDINRQATPIGGVYSEFGMLFQQKQREVYGMVLQKQV